MSLVIQTPEIFWSDFITSISRANDAISIRVMEFETGEKATNLTAVLKQKIKEGITVTLFIDWVYSKFVHGEIHLLPILNRQKRIYNAKIHAKTKQLLDELESAGVSVFITNTPSRLRALLPISGRNHTKIYIADDSVWIGGMHPVDSAFNNIDFMVKMQSPKIAAAIKNYAASKKNEIIPIDDSTQVLFDGGKIGDSCIYRHALASIEQAENEITFMSQFLSDGALLNKLIMKAKEGVAVKIITSPEKESIFTEFPANIFYRIHQSRLKSESNVQLIHCSRKVHAKLLVIDQKKVLFGSHNFASTGVWLGTEEVCIVSQDDLLVKDFLRYIQSATPAQI